MADGSAFAGVGALPPGTPASGYAKQARAALKLEVRLKLEAIEGEAAVAHARLRVLSDRARAAQDEQQRLTRRLEQLRTTDPTLHPGQWVPDRSLGPTGRRWVPAVGDNLADLERDLAQVTTDAERLTAERDVAQARWQAASQVAEQARDYLGVPRV